MYPEDLKYTKTHEWVRVKESIGVIGVTDFAVRELTDLVYVELPSIGEKITRGSSFGVVESVKAVSDLNSPVSGEVIKINKELANKPELITEDPYGKGWMIEVKIENLTELNALMDSKEYEKLTKGEEEK